MRGAAQAHWTSVVFSQGEPLRMRLDRRLPGLRGQMQAQEIRWASLAKRVMSMPISERIARALRSLTPGIVLICSMAVRKGAMPSPTSRSILTKRL